MADEYELKQVKVRLRLAEAEPLYSTEQITTPDKATEVMAQALSQLDREYCCVVNLDGANHPINFNVVSIGDVNQAHVPIQNVFKSAILSNASSIMMFHNHPSGSVKASREDIDVTKRLIEAGKIMNIPVLDHIIVAGGTAEHFSFRDNNPDMFKVREEAEYSVREPQAKLDPDRLMVRPTYRNFGVYEKIGENRATVLFEGTEEECRNKIRDLRDRYRESERGDSFTIYQLKDDESLRYIRFEGLDRIKKEGNTVDKNNYNLVYEAALKPGTTLDDIYYEFNMQRPLDFRGHSLSVSDIVVLHQGDEDKAFYVDRFGFAEIPDFLVEKEMIQEVETIESLTRERDHLTEELLEVEKFLSESGGSSDRPGAMQEKAYAIKSELAEVDGKLNNLYEQMEADAFDHEAAYKLGDRYISIQRTEEGYDYSIFDEEYRLLDGGVYDDPNVNIGEVLQEITDELKQPIYDESRDIFSHSEIQGNIRQSDIPERVDYEELMEKTEAVGLAEVEKVKSAQEIVEEFRSNTERLFRADKVDGMRPSDIEEAVRDRVQQMINEYELDARIEDVIVSGSRCRGLDNEKSDLDVVVSFSGAEREDDFFNILHDEKMFFGSVELDINPIGTEQTGTLAEYLPGVEKYLSEKSKAIDQSFREPALELMDKYGFELVAEQDKEHDFTLIRPKGERETHGFDGWQMIHDYFKDVDALVEQHSLPVLRGRLDGDLSKIPYGISDEQLRAAIRYKADQAIIRDFPERAEAVKQSRELERQPKQKVTFTVAESSEFHSFGELHEGIPTLQDALKIYEKLCEESKLNAIPALGINLHTVGTQEIEDAQWDFLSGGRLDLTGLMYLPEMSQNAEVMEALHELADTYPDVEIMGKFPEEAEKEAELPARPTAEELAVEIDRFAYETDTYEYNDTVDDREANIRGLEQSIETGQDGGARAYLNFFIQESEDPETVAQAKELLKKLDEYKPLAKVEEQVEQNYNMIDNVINNLPKDPEEKKEPTPQKVMRIEEHKKIRKRVSMKEKLAEKKAEIAERDSKPPEAQKVVKSQGMGVDD